MLVVTVFLGKMGIQVFPHLNDWLIKGQSNQLMEKQTAFIWSVLKFLGLMVSEQKLTLVPTQRMEFIGAVLDATQFRASLSESRFKAIALVHSLRACPMIMARTCLKLLGHMAACTYVVQHAQLIMRPIQMWLAPIYVPSRDSLD